MRGKPNFFRKWNFFILLLLLQCLFLFSNATGSLPPVSTYNYDPNNYLKSYTDYYNRTLWYYWDVLDRLQKVEYPDKSWISYEYQYTNLTRVHDNTLGDIIYKYGPLGLPTSITYPDGKEYQFEWDYGQNLRSITYPDREKVRYEYNPNDWLAKVTDRFGTYDFLYDEIGRLKEIQGPDNFKYKFSWDHTQIKTITDFQGKAITDFVTTFQWHPDHPKLLEKTITPFGVTRFSYDNKDKLTCITMPQGIKVLLDYYSDGKLKSISGPFSYTTYDKSGDITSFTDFNGLKTVYEWKDRENLRCIIDPFGGITNYDYDNRGKLYTITYPNGYRTTFEWDVHDQNYLTSVSFGGQKWHYNYDASKNLYSLTDPSGIERPLPIPKYESYNDNRLKTIITPLDFGYRYSAFPSWERSLRPPSWQTYLQDTKQPLLPTELSSSLATKGVTFPEVIDFIKPFWKAGIKEWGLEYHHAIDLSRPCSAIGENFPAPFIHDLRSGNLFKPSPIVPHYDLLNKFVTILPGIELGFEIYANWPHWKTEPKTFWRNVDRSLGEFYGKVVWGSAFGTAATVALASFSPWVSIPAVIVATGVGSHLGKRAFGNITSMYFDYVMNKPAEAPSLGNWTPPQILQDRWAYDERVLGIPPPPKNATYNEIIEHFKNYREGNYPGGGGGEKAVGGVLFDKAAQVLTDLEEITGAYWDDQLGQLVLTGKKSGKEKELYLPKMDRDHLAVAIRAVFTDSDSSPGIDIGREFRGPYEEGAPMPVSYDGDTDSTLFGATMFKCDKLLKNLAMGKDNETDEPVTSHVPGFANLLDLSEKYGMERPDVMQRLWFVIDSMKLEMPTKETADHNALTFVKSNLKVREEYVGGGSDPVAREFANHFTKHFDEFAKEFPEVDRLRELAKITAIAKYLKARQKPVDLSFLDNYEIKKVPTPDTTPLMIASKSNTWMEGDTQHTQTYLLFSGVDFSFKYESLPDDGEALSLKTSAQQAKPCETASTWSFNFKGVKQWALAIPLALLSIGNYTTSVVDLSIPSSPNLNMEIVRNYDSFNNNPSVFGYGWTLDIPYKLKIDKEMNTILLENLRNKISTKYARSGGAYYKVIDERVVESERRQEIHYTLDLSNSINHEKDRYNWKSEDGFSYTFGQDGELVSKIDRDNNSVNYTNDEKGRLVKISDSFNKEEVSLIYDDFYDRVELIEAPERTINYSYDFGGDLVKVLYHVYTGERPREQLSSEERGEDIPETKHEPPPQPRVKYEQCPQADCGCTYTYDAYHRLIEIADKYGNLILRKSYDPLGRVIEKNQDVVADAQGNPIIRTYDEKYRLVEEKDKEGNKILYEYDYDDDIVRLISLDKQNRKSTIENLGERLIQVTDPSGDTITVEYDEKDSSINIKNPRGQMTKLILEPEANSMLIKDRVEGNTIKLTYDSSGITSFTNANGQTMGFKYDDDGNLATIIDALGNEYKQEFDDRARLTKIVDPLGFVTNYRYDKRGNLVSVSSSEDSIICRYDKHDNPLEVIGSNGDTTEFMYDEEDNLIQSVDPFGVITKYSYDTSENSTTIIDAFGNAITYIYGESNRLVKVVTEHKELPK
jgi:YD repeat-containing protein